MNISDVTDPKLLQMIALCRREVPGFKLVYKDESPYMKFLDFFAQGFNPRFMTTYSTTTGSTVYVPREAFLANQKDYISALAHELVHMVESTQNPVLYFLRYAMPQLLAIFALPALLSFWWPWCLLFLVMLLALTPIPSSGRKNIELRGYSMNLAVSYWMYKKIPEETVQFYADQFTSSAYWFMWPWRESVVTELKLRAIAIRTNEVLADPLYRKIYDIVRA